MPSGYESILSEVLDRLTSPSPFVGGGYGVRRSHRTAIPRDSAPGAHILEGEDKPSRNNACGAREGDFTVAIFTRGDEGASLADPYKLDLYERMAAAWPANIVVTPGRITVETEIADGDAARVDCQFLCQYRTQGEWSLELP